MNVPVLGQPFSIIGYVLTPTLKCNCEGGGVVTLVVQSSAVSGFVRTQDACPSCKRLFTVAGFSAAADGQMQFSVEMSIPGPQLVTQ